MTRPSVWKGRSIAEDPRAVAGHELLAKECLGKTASAIAKRRTVGLNAFRIRAGSTAGTRLEAVAFRP